MRERAAQTSYCKYKSQLVEACRRGEMLHHQIPYKVNHLFCGKFYISTLHSSGKQPWCGYFQSYIQCCKSTNVSPPKLIDTSILNSLIRSIDLCIFHRMGFAPPRICPSKFRRGIINNNLFFAVIKQYHKIRPKNFLEQKTNRNEINFSEQF